MFQIRTPFNLARHIVCASFGDLGMEHGGESALPASRDRAFLRYMSAATSTYI